MLEHFFFCPYCNAQISMLLDISVPQQRYIEDCEVCCNPIEFDLMVKNNVIELFSAIPTDQ